MNIVDQISNPFLDDVEKSIATRFEQVADLHPLQTALGSGVWQPTYQELNAAANRLAHMLITHGGATGDRIALLLRHDTPLVAAVLAVLKAGRIVVALNPTDPPARLRQILADAEPVLIVTDLPNRQLAQQIAHKTHGLIYFEECSIGPTENPLIKIDPADLAFLVYTSGSTGRPKAVMQTHRNILHNVRKFSRGMNLRQQDRIILLGSLSGGQSIGTTWSALLNAATLCPFPVMEKGVIGLAGWMVAQAITVYISSASVFRYFMRTLDVDQPFENVRLVRLASEPATSNDFAAYRTHFSRQSVLLHTLSSSETGNISQHRMTPDDHIAEGRLPIGNLAQGMKILLLDDEGREVPHGQTGEIVVHSRFLSPGYWRNEALTREHFSEWANADGLRSFRSGDTAMRTADGVLVFKGRKDARVKIHGYRIEVSEIEDVLARQAEVERAIVLPRVTSGEDAQLIAYVVLRSGCKCSAETLRNAVRAILPAYMAPAAFVFLDCFPLTSHGKIDREKLGHINPATPVPSSIHEPITDTETLLANIWKDVFHHDVIGRDDDFFDLGGDSLNAALVAAKVHAALRVELDLRSFADHPALSSLAGLIDSLQPTGSTEASAGLVRIARDGPLRLSFAQERTWTYSQVARAAPGYTVACSYRIRGPLDKAILGEAMNYIARRHEILRTTFHEINERVEQRIHRAEPLLLPFVDLSSAADAEQQATLLLREDARRPFDLTRGPLLRFVLVRISPDEHWLLRVSHHIITDGWSWRIYFQELAILYEAMLRGDPPPLPDYEPLQYADFAVWQRQTLNRRNSSYQEAFQWWQNLLAPKARPPRFGFARSKPLSNVDPSLGLIWWGIDPAVSHRLDQIGRERGATYYIARLAAFVALLAAETRQSDVVLGTYVTNRTRLEFQNMFGFFSNLATLRFTFQANLTFYGWLAMVRKIAGDVQARREIPYEQLCRDLRASGTTPPEIRAIFSVSNQTAAVHFGNLELTWLDRRMEFMPWGFSMSLDQHNESQRCRVSFDAGIYDPARVREFLDRYINLLDAISRNPELPMAQLLKS